MRLEYQIIQNVKDFAIALQYWYSMFLLANENEVNKWFA